jgi:endonuclease YncB( thermonuclease family)
MTLLPPIECVVQRVIDGDTFVCASGERIRLAAIDANELHGGCHNQCASRSAIEARDDLARLTLGRRIACEATGRSYNRTVAWCRVGRIDLSCAQVRGGFAVRWARYDRMGRLCRGF